MENNNEACPIPSRDEDDRVREILGKPCTIAVVGMSPNPSRPSNEVGMYLHGAGFNVIPVYPKAEEINGLKVYADLESIPSEVQVDIVDLFVAGERTLPAVEQAARIKAKIVWFQPGAENAGAESRASELGLEVFSGRCTKADHQRLVAG